jgi:hypothetical protein
MHALRQWVLVVGVGGWPRSATEKYSADAISVMSAAQVSVLRQGRCLSW